MNTNEHQNEASEGKKQFANIQIAHKHLENAGEIGGRQNIALFECSSTPSSQNFKV